VGQKSKPGYFCNNFVYCWRIFIIFGTYTLQWGLGRSSRKFTFFCISGTHKTYPFLY